MNINGSNMEEFLDSSKQFYIPVFQRNYAWDEGDCAQLMHDLLAVDSSSLHHFFGSICYFFEPIILTFVLTLALGFFSVAVKRLRTSRKKFSPSGI